MYMCQSDIQPSNFDRVSEYQRCGHFLLYTRQTLKCSKIQDNNNFSSLAVSLLISFCFGKSKILIES